MLPVTAPPSAPRAIPDCIVVPAETESTSWGQNDPLVQAVVQSYRTSKMQGDARTAKQMLSLLLTIEGATQKEVMELCSYTDPVCRPGQDVWVAAFVNGAVRGSKVRGKLVSVDAAGLCTVDVEDKSAEGVAAERLQVPVGIVTSTKTVVCTFHQVRAAVNHAAMSYPGAPVPKMVRMLERLDPARAKYLAG